MKLVLCGSMADFDRFKRVLWEKDKSVRDYVYISTESMFRGVSRDSEIIRLGSFPNHPNYEEILEEANCRFPERPRRNTRSGSSDGNMRIYTSGTNVTFQNGSTIIPRAGYNFPVSLQPDDYRERANELQHHLDTMNHTIAANTGIERRTGLASEIVSGAARIEAIVEEQRYRELIGEEMPSRYWQQRVLGDWND